MSENDKMVIFGQYLAEGKLRNATMLMAVCQNTSRTVEDIRLKYGHLEAYTEILQAFSLLYNGDIKDFKKEYISEEEEEKEKKEDDGD
jgi:hypothetical protein